LFYFKSLKSLLLIIFQFLLVALIIFSGKIFLFGNILFSLLLILVSVPALWAMIIFKLKVNVAPEILKGTKLVKSGPYAVIRHPMYSSVISITLLWVVFDFDYIRLLLWTLLLVVILLKINYEEKILKKHFPDYKEYSKTTKKIIPFIY